MIVAQFLTLFQSAGLAWSCKYWEFSKGIEMIKYAAVSIIIFIIENVLSKLLNLWNMSQIEILEDEVD